MILIFCDGGLANRINSLVSGMVLAEILEERDYLVLWPVNNRCGAVFHDLFEPHCLALDTRLQDLLPYQETLNIWLHENDYGFLKSLPLRSITGIDALKALPIDRGRAILFAENMILPWFPPELVNAAINQLCFRDDIIRRTLAVLGAQIPGNFFGIHLRGTDFLPPPPVEHILDVVSSNSNFSFFICSDDVDIEKRFSCYDNVFIHNKTAYVEKLTTGSWRQAVLDSDGLPYTSNINRTSQSVVMACIDLLLLGASVPVRTSASSFFTLAEHLRDSGLITHQLTSRISANNL